MGNTVSYISSHGKRLLYRYNAQFRALKFLDKEKLPSAPRHALPPSLKDGLIDVQIDEQFQKKDPGLDKFLKDVYIKSFGEEPSATEQRDPLRPLPTYSETPKEETFQEPEEMIKGLCTLTQFFEFRSAHEDDPVENSASVIAKNYSLDVKNVENLLKYYSVFTVHEVKVKDEDEDEDGDKSKSLMDKMSVDQILDIRNKFLEKAQKNVDSKGDSKDEADKKRLQLESQERETVKPDRQEVKN